MRTGTYYVHDQFPNYYIKIVRWVKTQQAWKLIRYTKEGKRKHRNIQEVTLRRWYTEIPKLIGVLKVGE